MESSIASSLESVEAPINDPFVDFIQNIREQHSGGAPTYTPLKFSALSLEMGWVETLLNLGLLVLIFYLSHKLYLSYKSKKEPKAT